MGYRGVITDINSEDRLVRQTFARHLEHIEIIITAEHPRPAADCQPDVPGPTSCDTTTPAPGRD